VLQKQKVAFCGRTGSGKSTVLGLIYNLYESFDGTILIDSIDIRDLDEESLSEKITVVP
jgi:ATP-binding cassette subfamily B protein